MDDITSTILDAWQAISPTFKSKPLELAKRLARRRMKTLRNPLRGWCLAVRASDQRINPATAGCVPEDACYEGHPGLFREHEVTLDARLLRRICRPVILDPPGVDWKTAAKLLGCHKNNLVISIRAGLLKVNHVKGLSGQFGKPIPIVWSPHPIDPASSRVGEAVDPIWGSMWQHLADMVDDNLEQTITRLPRLGLYRKRYVMRGWDWICPACKKHVRRLYYPLPPINLPEFFKVDPAKQEWDQIEKPPATFACSQCHRIMYFARVDKNAWNCLVHHLSGGLLYGYEVKKPAWLTPDRKRPYRPLIGRAPSKRREEVLQRLLWGWKDKQIAMDLGISHCRTENLVRVVLRQHRVGNRKELRKLLGCEDKDFHPQVSQTTKIEKRIAA